jgi:Thioredoxin-like
MPDKQLIEWLHDYDAAVAQAQRTNKPVLIDFTAAPM